MGSSGGSKILIAKCMVKDAEFKDEGSDYIPSCKDFALENPTTPQNRGVSLLGLHP